MTFVTARGPVGQRVPARRNRAPVVRLTPGATRVDVNKPRASYRVPVVPLMAYLHRETTTAAPS